MTFLFDICYKTKQKPQNQVKLGEVAISDQILTAYKKANNNNQPADCVVEVERLTDSRLRKAKTVYVSFLRTGETPAIDQVILLARKVEFYASGKLDFI